MSKQYKEITMQRVCTASKVFMAVDGSIANWPPWAAKTVVAEAARWANDGFKLDDSVAVERIGADMGGHPIVRVTPVLTNGPCSRTAGKVWQTALEAVLLAQNA